MTIQAILMPLFVQVGLTFVLLFWMARAALPRRPLRRGRPRESAAARAQLARRVCSRSPTPTTTSSSCRCCFTCVMLLAMITRTLDVVIYVLAWMFVLSRLVHAYIHVTSNRLDRRTGVFGIGAIALLLMWVIVVARILLFSAA